MSESLKYTYSVNNLYIKQQSFHDYESCLLKMPEHEGDEMMVLSSVCDVAPLQNCTICSPFMKQESKNRAF